MPTPNVILIGGVSGAGKTTLGKALANRLGAERLTVDDLAAGARGITTAESHPGLHGMTQAVTGLNWIEYCISRSVEQLTSDATAEHLAMWPAVQGVIRLHASKGPQIVIDGWYFRPEMISELDNDNVASFWLVAKREVLEERERNFDEGRNSSDAERFLANFLGRSYWYNDLIEEQAKRFDLPILYQDGSRTPDDLVDAVMEHLEQVA